MNDLALLQRRSRVAALYLQGWTRDNIALELGCAQGTVSQDLEVVREMWAESVKHTLEQLRVEELARLKRVEATAWEKGQLYLVLKCIELRVKMLGLLRDTTVNVNQFINVPWDEIVRDGPDPIEARITALEG